jgi:hypothetical protein
MSSVHLCLQGKEGKLHFFLSLLPFTPNRLIVRDWEMENVDVDDNVCMVVTIIIRKRFYNVETRFDEKIETNFIHLAH